MTDQIELTPKLVAGLLATQGLKREDLWRPGPISYVGGLERPDGEFNDRVRVVRFAEDSPAVLLPAIDRHNLKVNWLLIINDPNPDQTVFTNGFWEEVLDELDSTETQPTWPGLHGNLTLDQYLDTMDAAGYASCTRDGIVEARRRSYDAQKTLGDITPETTFKEFVGNDEWLGEVAENEGLGFASTSFSKFSNRELCDLAVVIENARGEGVLGASALAEPLADEAKQRDIYLPHAQGYGYVTPDEWLGDASTDATA